MDVSSFVLVLLVLWGLTPLQEMLITHDDLSP